MAQLSILIVTEDTQFRSAVTDIVRSSGVPIGILAEALSDSSERSVDVAFVDVRAPEAGWREIEAVRSRWTSTSIVAVAGRVRPRPDPSGNAGGRQRVLCMADRECRAT